MMEKDLNERQPDKLIQDWTEGLLDSDTDRRIADSLLDFVDTNYTENDVEDLLDFHIHRLAVEEAMSKRRKWKTLLYSVAAASVVIFIVAAIFLTTHEYGLKTDKTALAAENQLKDKTAAVDCESPVTIADSSKTIVAKAVIKGKSEIMSFPKRKRNHAGKETTQHEATTKPNLTETIAEINAGLASMVDNAKECMDMSTVSLRHVNLFSGSNESIGFDLIPDEYSSIQHSGQMQELNIIETNLINTLYEIRNLNIDLNFETEYIKTEI